MAPASGWWEPHTAPIDWCEENYAVTPAIAEFWNTASNIPFVLIGLHVLYMSHLWQLGLKFRLMGLAVVLTGVTSAWFHATLKWEGQKTDEIFENLIFLAMVYTAFDHGKIYLIMLVHWVLVAALILLVENVFCEIHLFVVVLATIATFYFLPAENKPIDYVIRGGLLGGIGFSLWLADFFACDWMKIMPANPQGHAWWHVLSAAGINESAIACAIIELNKRCGEKVSIRTYSFLGIFTIVDSGPVLRRPIIGAGSPPLVKEKANTRRSVN